MSETQTSAAAEAGANPPNTAAPLFYRRPELLSAAQHAGWRIKPGGVGFTAEASSVPVVVSEFVASSHSYPLVFAGPEHVPVAVLGLAQKNRFVKGESWQSDAYIPAYVRRYPFVFAQVEGGFALAVDAEAPNVIKSGDEGEPLFVDGQPSTVTQQALQFCESFTREHAATQAFVKLLENQKLLVERSINITNAQGQRSAVTGFSMVDEAAYIGLPESVIIEWHRKGWTALVHAHLSSLARFPMLLAE